MSDHEHVVGCALGRTFGVTVAGRVPHGHADANYNVRLLDLETLEWVGSDGRAPVGSHLTYAPDGSQFRHASA